MTNDDIIKQGNQARKELKSLHKSDEAQKQIDKLRVEKFERTFVGSIWKMIKELIGKV